VFVGVLFLLILYIRVVAVFVLIVIQCVRKVAVHLNNGTVRCTPVSTRVGITSNNFHKSTATFRTHCISALMVDAPFALNHWHISIQNTWRHITEDSNILFIVFFYILVSEFLRHFLTSFSSASAADSAHAASAAAEVFSARILSAWSLLLSNLGRNAKSSRIPYSQYVQERENVQCNVQYTLLFLYLMSVMSYCA
jgi:hypothetical protein